MEDLRRKMEEWWRAANAEAVAQKNSQDATLRLISEYERLNSEERAVADEVLADWSISGDEAKRFDALAVIDHFGVRTAIPRLRQLAAMLAGSNEPGAPFEQARIDRLLRRLR